MKSKLGVFLSVVSAMFVVSGCADNYSGNTYQSNRAGIVQNVSYGTVTNIRQVNIQDDSSNMPIGAVAGAVVGDRCVPPPGSRATAPVGAFCVA